MAEIDIRSGKGIAERLEEIKREEELIPVHIHVHVADGRGKPAMCGPKYLLGIEYPCNGSCCREKPNE